MVIEVKVDPSGKFDKEIRKWANKVDDLTIPLGLITKRWFESNESIFTLGSSGQYKNLTDKYAKRKKKKLDFVFPILLGKNELIKKAITDPADENAVHQVLNKKTLLLGITKTKEFPYPIAHHLGSRKQNIPARPFLFTGAEQILPDGHAKSKRIYVNIIRDHILRVTGAK